MKALTAAVVEQTHRQHSSSPWIWLYEVFVRQTSTAVEVYRATSHDVEVTWSSKTFRPAAIRHEPVRADASGNLPSLALKLSNITREINRYADEQKGSTGNELWVTGLNRATLAPTDGRTWKFAILSTQLSHPWVTLQLGPPKFFRRQVPPGIYTRGRCENVYQDPLTCKYRGTLPTCLKTLVDCRVHGDDEVNTGLPRLHPRQFVAFPAIARRSV